VGRKGRKHEITKCLGNQYAGGGEERKNHRGRGKKKKGGGGGWAGKNLVDKQRGEKTTKITVPNKTKEGGRIEDSIWYEDD